MKNSLWHQFIHPVTSYFRKKRGQFLLKLYPDITKYKICDVGGSIHFWEKTGLDIHLGNITIYNITSSETSALAKEVGEKIHVKLYDGKSIPEENLTFDLVVCNSVIEHVPLEDRARFAKELDRIGKRLYLQTPAYEFFLEPHFVMPFIHWLPDNLGYMLAYISPWRIMSRPTKETIRNYFWGTRLLKRNELDLLFPDAYVYRERFAGMTKSYMVCLDEKA
jgi:hypothetical protein